MAAYDANVVAALKDAAKIDDDVAIACATREQGAVAVGSHGEDCRPACVVAMLPQFDGATCDSTEKIGPGAHI